MRIPFDVKFRPQIESGEYKVETRSGKQVRVICWNKKSTTKMTIVVLCDDGDSEHTEHYTEKGTVYDRTPAGGDLFIITPEPELSEFEKKLSDVVGYAISLSVAEPKKPTSEFVKEYASELLDLAREELFANDAVLKEYAEVAREQGKAEALKDLPRWRKVKGARGYNYSQEAKFSINGRCLEMNDTLNDIYEISFEELEKLSRL